MDNVRKCLVVDDASVVRKVARVLIEDHRFEVTEAEDARTALDMCKSEMPELILLDWHMPGLSPLDFLATLRAMGGAKRPFVLYMATEIDVNELTKAFQAGADDYLLKPFDRQSLEAKLAEIPAAALAVA
jgi:two-component system chemotaxis response regulator CheY